MSRELTATCITLLRGVPANLRCTTRLMMGARSSLSPIAKPLHARHAQQARHFFNTHRQTCSG